jgi:pimeloyl-ACP methyl ester carboxylesterase
MERWFSARFFQDDPVALAGWRNLFLRTNPDGYCGTCATLRDTDLTGEVGTIARPTLFVVGRDDLSTPPDLVKAAAAAIPGARFEIIAGAGHIPSIEQPEELASLMKAFLSEAGHG